MMSQTVSGLDNGIYEVRVFGIAHNERNDGATLTGRDRTTAYVFATSGESEVRTPILASGTNVAWEGSRGDELSWPYTIHDVTVKDGTITIGYGLNVAGLTNWHVIQIYSLTKTGDLPLTEKIEAYEAALAIAQEKVIDAALPTGFRNALQVVIDENSGENKPSYTDAEALDNATAALNAANTTAESSREPGGFLSSTIALAGEEGVDVTDASNVLATATTVEALNNALSALRIARRLANAETDDNNYAGNAPAAGDFYLYNVGQKRFLCGGDDWGAHAALGFPGVLMTLVADGDNFQIDTHLSLDGNNHFLNNGAYCDAGAYAWKFVQVGDGIYNITKNDDTNSMLGYTTGTYNRVDNGKTNGNDPNNQWKLVTKADRDALIPSATAENPVDVSYYIQSPGFSQREDVSKWELSNTAIWGRGANHPDFAIEAYNQTAASVQQTVTGLPAGNYELRVQAFYRDGGFTKQVEILEGGGEAIQLATLFAGTKSALIQNVSVQADKAPGIGRASAVGYMPDGIDDACLYFQNGLYWASLDDIIVGEDGKMTIGARKTEKMNDGDWFVLDNFRLLYKGTDVDLTPLENDLQNKIDEAQALINNLGLNLSYVGEAISSGEALLESEEKTADDLINAYNALQEVIDQTNAIDFSIFKQTVALAEAESINTTAEVAAVEAANADGITAAINAQLYVLRSARKINALGQPDIYTGATPAEGEYYLYNIGTGMWLENGSDWNTHAAVGLYGIPVTLVADGSTFKMQTNINGEKKYIDWNAYVDTNGQNTWNFLPVDGQPGVYTIGSTTNDGNLLGYDPNGLNDNNNYPYWNNVSKDRSGFGKPNNQWKLVSVAEREALADAATEVNPVEVNYLVNNGGLSRVWGLDMWTKVCNGGNGGAHVSSGENPKTEDFNRNSDYGYEVWNANSFSYTQELTGLRPGKYIVSVNGFFRQGNGDYQASIVNNGGELISEAYLIANDETEYLPNIATEAGKLPGIASQASNNGTFANWPAEALAAFETGLYDTSVEVTVGLDGNLTIGIKQDQKTTDASWVLFDNFRLTYLGAPEEEIEVTISDALYATLVAPFDATMPEGVTASTATVAENGTTIELTPVEGAVPAHTPVILSADEAKDFTISGKVTKAAPAELKEGALVGTYKDMDAPEGSYVLQKQDDKVGFYLVDYSQARPMVRKNRAYLVAPDGGVKAFIIGPTVDAINGVEVESDNAKIYNVAGQSMSKLQRGVNIIRSTQRGASHMKNGKKVIVK